MFRSPMSSLSRDEEKPKKTEKYNHDVEPENDDVANSLTVNQHHDGHYSTDGPDGEEPTHHDDMEAVKKHMHEHFGEELQEAHGEFKVRKAEPPSKHGYDKGMM